MKTTALTLSLGMLLFLGCADKTVSSAEKSAKSPFFMTKPQPTEPVTLVFDKKYDGKKPEKLSSE